MRIIEWLLETTSSPTGYDRLYREAGALGPAAWRLAQAQCMTREHATHVPTRLEVRAAARQLASRLGLDRIPSSEELAQRCEALGMPVL